MNLKLFLSGVMLSCILFILTIYYKTNYNDYNEIITINDYEEEYFWVGNTLVSTVGFNYVSKFDLNSTITFMGDSQSRRLAINMALFSKGISDNVEHDSDQFTHNKLLNIHGTNINFIWAPCVNNAIEKIKKINKGLIVYSTSVHYTNGGCTNRDFKNDLELFSNENFDNVIWRIQPDFRKNGELNSELLNNSTINTIDHYSIMKSRMYGKYRIKGNTKDHFGVDGRIAMAQHLYRVMPVQAGDLHS